MKKKHLLFLLSLLLIPTLVFAESESGSDSVGLFGITLLDGFFSIFHYFFIVFPVISANSKSTIDFKKGFKTYLVIFIINMIIYEFLGNNWIPFAFISIFMFGFPMTLFASIVKRGHINETIITDPSKTIPGCAKSVIVRCTVCNTVLKPNDKFCGGCGSEFKDDNAKVEEANKNDIAIPLNSFDPMYAKSEDDLITYIIQEEMKNLEVYPSQDLIPRREKARLVVLNVIFSILLFLYIGLIFYHVSLGIYLIGFVILSIFFFTKNKIDITKYILKEVKSRPGENIDNIIGSIKENLVSKRTIISGIVLPILIVVIGAFVFKNPIIFYEQLDEGYAMRYYFTGWSSLTHAEIPAEHKGKPVISLRGNAFSNMPYLKEVYLPDSITEIRGEAFKNDYNLVKVHLPANLKTLGGESFYNCYKLSDINLTYETPLEEIRGDTFEECHSLKEITIPDSVTRIGGHAFYNDYSLSVVNVSENSQIKEIGSSAFRKCTSLKSIKLPASASINSKAFKESPTKVHKYGETESQYPEHKIVLFEKDKESVNLTGFGKLNIEYKSYDKKTNTRNINLSGILYEKVVLTGNYTLYLDDYNYIYFEVSDSTSAVYIYFYIN